MATVEDDGQLLQRLPDTLRGVLLVRLSSCSETASRLVEVAAVAGRQVEHAVLAEVCGLSEIKLRAALRESVDAQLLVVDTDREIERYRFRHALVQEAVYDELLPSERRVPPRTRAPSRNVPRAVAVAGASRLVQLAHHWTAAHDPARALTAAIDAGDASTARLCVRRGGSPVPAGDRAVGCRPGRGRDRPIATSAIWHDAASAAATVVGDIPKTIKHGGNRAIEHRRCHRGHG